MGTEFIDAVMTDTAVFRVDYIDDFKTGEFEWFVSILLYRVADECNPAFRIECIENIGYVVYQFFEFLLAKMQRGIEAMKFLLVTLEAGDFRIQALDVICRFIAG